MGKSFCGALSIESAISVQIRGCRFEGNVAFLGSGAVDISGVSGGQGVEIRDTYFCNNSALLQSGGGIRVSDSSFLKFVRTNFSNNTAFVSGGAIRLESVQEIALVEVYLVANVAKSGGGGAISMLQVDKAITLINSVL